MSETMSRLHFKTDDCARSYASVFDASVKNARIHIMADWPIGPAYLKMGVTFYVLCDRKRRSFYFCDVSKVEILFRASGEMITWSVTRMTNVVVKTSWVDSNSPKTQSFLAQPSVAQESPPYHHCYLKSHLLRFCSRSHLILVLLWAHRFVCMNCWQGSRWWFFDLDNCLVYHSSMP